MSHFRTILQECKFFLIISFSFIPKCPWKKILSYAWALIILWKKRKQTTCSVNSSRSLFYLVICQGPILLYSGFQSKSGTKPHQISGVLMITLADSLILVSYVCVCVCVCVCVYTRIYLVLVGNWGYIIEESDSLWHRGLYSPGQNNGVSSPSLLQGSCQHRDWTQVSCIDVEAENPILLPPDAKSWLIWKDLDAGKDWGQEEKGMTGDEIAGWHHRLNGHEFG